jgi:hypothetical protein
MSYTAYARLNVHVGATAREVIRAVYARMIPEARTARYRASRKAILRDRLAEHKKAQELYSAVTSGFFRET